MNLDDDLNDRLPPQERGCMRALLVAFLLAVVAAVVLYEAWTHTL